MRRLAIFIVLGVASASQAVFTVVPNASAGVGSTGGLNTVIRDLNNPRTAQLMIDPLQLGGWNVGDTITGMAFRLNVGSTSTWTGGTWADYEVRIGQGIGTAAMTATFATNFTGGSTLAQDGALTMSGFSVGGSPNAFSNDIVFTTPHVYTGGALLIEIRHAGQIAAFPVATFCEAVASNPTLGYRSFTAVGQTTATGAAATFTVTRLTTTPVPEPATMAILGLGVVPFLRRRRK